VDYNLIEPIYSDLVRDKTIYLDSVDSFLIDSLSNHRVSNFLDIGCGDGLRTLKLHKELDCKVTEGVDLSEGMIATAKANHGHLPGVTFYSIETLQDIRHDQSDLVTMLWNVLGHVPEELRLEFLKEARKKVRLGGCFFLDVNNFYYYRYGRLRSFFRVIQDKLSPPKDFGSGDLFFHMNVGANQVRCSGHIFRPSEIVNLVKKSGFLVEKIKFIDYKNGKLSNFYCSGQISILCRNPC
jgi:2-polyprenyl-3-methyl-5-hydroxy-6-metoxy-1,4-benzoquinol methylase